MAEAQLTGNYMPAEARQAINDILTFKNQAETKGTTAQQRADLSAQADNRRRILESLGINSAAYGANVNANNAAQNANTGFRTLQGQQQDLQRKESNLNAANVVSQMTGRAVTSQDDWQGLMRQANSPNTPLTLQGQQQQFNNSLAARQQEFTEGQQGWENQFNQAKFNEDVRQFGLQYAISQQQLALSQDDNARQWADLDFRQANPKGASGGLTANQVLQSMQGLYSVPVYGKNAVGDSVKEGTKITTDHAQRQQMFQNVVDAGLSDAETRQVLSSLGMSKKEIDDYKKLYQGN